MGAHLNSQDLTANNPIVARLVIVEIPAEGAATQERGCLIRARGEDLSGGIGARA
jgi:hypothetical protein